MVQTHNFFLLFVNKVTQMHTWTRALHKSAFCLQPKMKYKNKIKKKYTKHFAITTTRPIHAAFTTVHLYEFSIPVESCDIQRDE